MSALPPKADMCGAVAHVRFGPKADITGSPACLALMVRNLGLVASHDAGETPKLVETFGGFTY